MNAEVFEYENYKVYLNDRLDNPGRGGGRGCRTKLSKAIGCQTAYTAQVLRGAAHFSLEQGEGINEFLGHTDEEGHFFLLLIQRERAGTKKLQNRFEQQMKGIREKRLLLSNRLKVSHSLEIKDQVTYYSAWYFAAIHALVSIPKFRNITEIAKHLNLDVKKVREVADFLVAAGLLVYESPKGSTLIVGRRSIHLGADSPLIAKHHTNWRLQALRALERSEPENLHYSSAISVSEADAARIREILVKTIEMIKPIIRESKEETVQCLSFDLFKV